jgi:CHAT domain-containing protein
MKQFIAIFTLIIVPIHIVFAQTTDIWEKKAESLSNLAEFYYVAHNYDKAIENEQLSLNIKDSIHGKNSLQYALSALNIAKYYYTRGNANISSSSLSNPEDLKNATSYLIIAKNTIKETLLRGFYDMDSQSKYKIWQSINNLYDNTFPSYVARNQNDSTISELYNSTIFSKGITWRNKSTKTWKDIQYSLQDREIAIEFISPVTPEGDNVIFYALTIKKEYKVPQMTKLFDIRQIQDSFKNSATIKEKNIKVGELIWKALGKELNGVKNVYFSPTHILHNIAIEYLPTDNGYYCDTINFYRLSSTIELTKPRIERIYKNAVLYGGLEYEHPSNYEDKKRRERSGFEPLYNTIIEISKISNILGNTGVKCISYSGIDGDESSFLNLSKQEIDILHLATHGMWIKTDIPLDGDKALSGSFLALSKVNNHIEKENNDGRITALEISNLNLSHIDLTVLSACESGLGEFGFDDGLLGLQRGFKIAGIKTILMSLDKVDDEATSILMVEFYKNLMSGKTKHQSLKNAQKHLRSIENGKFDAPKYWASFIMLDGLN